MNEILQPEINASVAAWWPVEIRRIRSYIDTSYRCGGTWMWLIWHTIYTIWFPCWGGYDDVRVYRYASNYLSCGKSDAALAESSSLFGRWFAFWKFLFGPWESRPRSVDLTPSSFDLPTQKKKSNSKLSSLSWFCPWICTLKFLGFLLVVRVDITLSYRQSHCQCERLH